MKVMYMSHRYHTNQTTIMKGWVESGHEVRFLSQYAGAIEDYTYVKPIVVGYSKFFLFFYYIYVNILNRKDPYAIDIRLKYGIPPLFKLAKYIREFKPDVAILRERSMYTICMNAICRHYKIPTILYNMSPVWEKPKKKDLAHKLVWKLTPEYRITPTNLIGIDFNGLEQDAKAFWAPYLMEPQLAPQDKEYFREGHVNIICVGKYLEQKNHHMVIEVVEELLSKYDLHLTIIGEVSRSFHEEYYARLEKYVETHKLQSKITFLKNLNRDEMTEEYKKADVCVLASTREAASVTLVEALAFSMPAISGTDNGTASYIENGKSGYVFEDNDKADLKQKLEAIVCDRENLKVMGAAAYQRVEDCFQFRNYYEQIQTIMGKIEKE